VGAPGAAGGASAPDAAPALTQPPQWPYSRVIRYGGAGAGAADGGAALPLPSPTLLAAASDRGGADGGGGGGHAASTSWGGVESPQRLSAGHFTLGTAAGGVGAMRTSSRLRVFEDIKVRGGVGRGGAGTRVALRRSAGPRLLCMALSGRFLVRTNRSRLAY